MGKKPGERKSGQKGVKMTLRNETGIYLLGKNKRIARIKKKTKRIRKRE